MRLDLGTNSKALLSAVSPAVFVVAPQLRRAYIGNPWTPQKGLCNLASISLR